MTDLAQAPAPTAPAPAPQPQQPVSPLAGATIGGGPPTAAVSPEQAFENALKAFIVSNSRAIPRLTSTDPVTDKDRAAAVREDAKVILIQSGTQDAVDLLKALSQLQPALGVVFVPSNTSDSDIAAMRLAPGMGSLRIEKLPQAKEGEGADVCAVRAIKESFTRFPGQRVIALQDGTDPGIIQGLSKVENPSGAGATDDKAPFWLPFAVLSSPPTLAEKISDLLAEHFFFQSPAVQSVIGEILMENFSRLAGSQALQEGGEQIDNLNTDIKMLHLERLDLSNKDVRAQARAQILEAFKMNLPEAFSEDAPK